MAALIVGGLTRKRVTVNGIAELARLAVKCNAGKRFSGEAGGV